MMKLEITKKELKFLVGVLGPMRDESYKENINRSLALSKEEKEILIEFVDNKKTSNIFEKLNSLNEEKRLHYK